jgi:hypothetical protein
MSSLEEDFAIIRGISKKENIMKTTLDNFFDENKLKIMYPFIKIDVEGHEMNVISGAEKIINDLKPTFLIEVFSKENIIKLFLYFSSFGYKVYGLNFGDKHILTAMTSIEAFNDYQASDYLFVFQESIMSKLRNLEYY